MNFYFKTENVIGKFSRCAASLCLMAVFVLFLLNIATRASFITWNPTWIDEVIQFFLVWMIFLAAAELVRTGEHFMVDILIDKLRGTAKGRWCKLFASLIMFVTYLVILYFGIKLCVRTNVKATFTLPVFVKMSWFYACIPVSALFMTVFSIRDLYYAIADLASGGKIMAKLDKAKAQAQALDEDAKAIAEAAKTLKRDQKN